MKRRQHLGEMLVNQKVITWEVLDSSIEEARRTGKRLGRLLIEKGYLTDQSLARFLEKQLEMPVVPITAKYKLDRKLFKLIPHKYCMENMLTPLKFEKGNLVIAMADPTNFTVIDEVRFMADSSVDVVLATENSIIEFLAGKTQVADKAESKKGESKPAATSSDMSLSLGSADYQQAVDNLDNINEQELAEMADDAPVVKLVNSLIMEAIERKASDIHIESYESEMKIKYRIDGILYELPNPPPRAMQPALISRIKIISRLDISERRLPQDGRIGLDMDGRKVDLRVSIVPAIHGENVVLRILDKGAVLLDMEQLGLTKKEVDLIKKVARQPHGMFLVAGPTGSGKTTTLYAILQYVKGFEKKILTIEDPVEYQLDGVTQVQTHAEIGLDFARGLRSFLRHDPDVIMVGEIRDLETAEIAIRAALTGHMVLSTVHTNDSPSAVTRFVDMGVPPYLVTATFNLVLSQRLVRRICPQCKKRIRLTAKKIQDLGVKGRFREGSYVYEGEGCSACNNSGYQGRFAVFEIMVVSERVQDMVLRGASLMEIRAAARKDGMKTLMDQAFLKVKSGHTTIEEAMRISSSEEIEFDELF